MMILRIDFGNGVGTGVGLGVRVGVETGVGDGFCVTCADGADVGFADCAVLSGF